MLVEETRLNLQRFNWSPKKIDVRNLDRSICTAVHVYKNIHSPRNQLSYRLLFNFYYGNLCEITKTQKYEFLLRTIRSEVSKIIMQNIPEVPKIPNHFAQYYNYYRRTMIAFCTDQSSHCPAGEHENRGLAVAG